MSDEIPPVPPVSPIPPSPDPVPPLTPEYAGPAGIEMNKDARLWGMLCHLGALAGVLGIPFGNVLGPLIFWLIKKNDYPFVDDQGKESLNFQITVAIAEVASGLLICIGIGFVLLIIVILAAMVFAIIGGVKANQGIAYRYPFAIRLIK